MNRKYIKRRNVVRNLNLGSFARFGKELADKLDVYGMESESTKLLVSLRQMNEARGMDRHNPSVPMQNDLLRMVSAKVGDLRRIISRCEDENETTAYFIYKKTIGTCKGRGLGNFLGTVEQFLEGLGDLEFDGTIASFISEIRILMSRLDTKIADKNEDAAEISARKSASKMKQEIYDDMCVLFAKIEVADSAADTNWCKEISDLIVKAKNHWLTKPSDDEDEESERQEAEAEGSLS